MTTDPTTTPTPAAPGPPAAIHEPLLELTAQSQGHAEIPEEIPAITMRVILLLEKLNSPFTREPEAQRNPITGEIELEPARDKKGNAILGPGGEPRMVPVMVGARPTVQEVMEAFYVVMKQGDPRILTTIRSEDFESTILQYASGMTPVDVRRVSAQIGQRMMELNEAAAAVNGGQSPKKADGPMES